MAAFDIFKGKENKELKQRIDELEALLTPELRDIQTQKLALAQLQHEYEQRKKTFGDELMKLSAQRTAISSDIASANRSLSSLKAQIIQTQEEIMLQSFGVYHPTYAFASSEQYKERLEAVRNAQKELIKKGLAATGAVNWSINGNAAQGKKMIEDMQKLLIRAFNSEADALIDSVRYSNYDTILKRMTASRDAISKLGKMMSIAITERYFQSKVDELKLALEYQIKKQEEKEAAKRAREELREQAKLAKEVEEARKKIDKERTHYGNALQAVIAKLSTCSEDEKQALLEKKSEYESQLMDLDKAKQEVDYREANQKAGYVYIISNIGAFGENVYKIGMTRRLEPMDRIDELGDASVPFDFDVHALIFSDDAPALEAALHKAFDNRKVNMINQRREFFRVSLDEIEAVVKKNYDKTVEFIRIPPAEQFRMTQKIIAEESL